jgi:uncharacterized protein (DUF111 family)
VYVKGEKDLPREVFWEQQKHDHEHPHDHEHVHGRGLTEISESIEKAAISGTAKATAIRIFEALGEAEAEIHNTSIERVDFHEVGAVDAMVDVVCAAVGAPGRCGMGVRHWMRAAAPSSAARNPSVPAPAALKLSGCGICSRDRRSNW